MIGRLIVMLGLMLAVSACQPSAFDAGTEGEDGVTDETTTNTEQKPDVPLVDQVGGRVTYQDRIYNDSGFITGNTPEKPARLVPVDLLDASGAVIAAGRTSHSGHYAFERIPAGNYTLRILARTEAETGETISVHTMTSEVYAVSNTVTFDLQAKTADVAITLASRMAGPFNILDVMLSGVEFYHHWSPGASALNDLDVFWQFGSSPGTFTCLGLGGSCSNGSGVYVLSDPYDSGDTDEFDDDVLWHEFAHHVEFSNGMTDSPGGYHSLADTHLDLRLSWSEGVANYLQAAIKTWLREHHPERLSIPGYMTTSYYIDSRSSYAFSVDLAEPPLAFAYATNETAVAKVLWELQQSAGQARVWRPLIEELPANAFADTLEAYWDGLLQSQPTTLELGRWRAALLERAIHYQADALESDQTFATANYRDCRYTGQTLPTTCVLGERHSLYHYTGLGDTDTLSLEVTAGAGYRIWTHDLRNGADTRIGLYRADGSLVLDNTGAGLLNDDAVDCETLGGGCSPLHDGSNFASMLTFQAQRDEPLYLVIDSADAAWNTPVDYGYLARYGDYAVSVSLIEAPP